MSPAVRAKPRNGLVTERHGGSGERHRCKNYERLLAGVKWIIACIGFEILDNLDKMSARSSYLIVEGVIMQDNSSYDAIRPRRCSRSRAVDTRSNLWTREKTEGLSMSRN